MWFNVYIFYCLEVEPQRNCCSVSKQVKATADKSRNTWKPPKHHVTFRSISWVISGYDSSCDPLDLFASVTLKKAVDGERVWSRFSSGAYCVLHSFIRFGVLFCFLNKSDLGCVSACGQPGGRRQRKCESRCRNKERSHRKLRRWVTFMQEHVAKWW